MNDIAEFNYAVVSSVIPQLGKGVDLSPKGFQFIVQGEGGVNGQYWFPANMPDYVVDFGDGSTRVIGPSTNDYDVSHTYAEDGEYTITVTEDGSSQEFISGGMTPDDTWLEVLTPFPDYTALGNIFISAYFQHAQDLRAVCGKLFIHNPEITSLRTVLYKTSLSEVPVDLLSVYWG